MKKITDKIKNLKLFTKLMIVYIIVMIAGITVLCIKEWNALESYQSDYERAKEKSSPELFMEEYLESLTIDKYRELLLKVNTTEYAFYTGEDIAEKMTAFFDESSIRLEKNREQYKDNSPVYNIFSGDNKLLTVYLGVSKRDDFGFNIWKESKIEINTDMLQLESTEFVIDSTMTAKVNGIQVDEKYIKETFDKKLTETLDGVTEEQIVYYRYSVKELLDKEDLRVYDVNGSETGYTQTDSYRDYTLLKDGEEKQEAEARIDEIMTKYINYLNKYSDMNSMLDVTVYESNAYAGIKDTTKAMVWVWRPESLEIKEKEIKNIRKVSDDIILCQVNYNIYKTYSDGYVSESLSDETISLYLALRKSDGVWKLENFHL